MNDPFVSPVHEMMSMSPNITDLATALSKAQGALSGARKDSANPFFKSKYADLESVWDACREVLAKNGLSVIQTVSSKGERVIVTTMLAHSSGQWIKDSMALTPKDAGPQAMGSCITYGRRYGLAAIVGVYQTDDDGEAAQGRNGKLRDSAGDLSMVPQGMAADLAQRMKAALDADIEENEKALRVADLHRKVRTESELYIAASELLTAGNRRAWKEFCKMGERLGNEMIR